MKKSIPNILTLGNLFCGSLAIISAVNGGYITAFYLIIASVIFDFFDGFAARALKAYSPIGKELDSLADMVSFGVAPAIVVYMIGLQHVGLLIALFSALRLAKFNIDERQTTTFIGLPTPANALLFMSIGYIVESAPQSVLATYFTNNIVLTFFTLLFSYLLVAEIPMFSLKFKTYNFKKNALVYIFLIISAAAIAIFQITAIPFVIIGYVAVSIIHNFIAAKKIAD
ncbi:MAG: CDP-diacylglycerol--serine O-phosphatidyltransferase [Rikenellaceae bacterium]